MERVTYAKLVNLGNYENERFEVELVIEDQESYADAFDRARRIVEENAERVRLARVEARRQRDAADPIPF